MLALLALASALVADAPPSPPSDPAAVRREYEAARAAAGRSPEDQVRLAYWCEAHGLDAERLRHLAQAVLADPTNAAARGLLGLVARDGRWLAPAAVARQQADPAAAALLAEYDARRAATPYTAAAQFDLGVWADDRGLKDQARAHWTAAVRLDPGRDAAWRRLGYVKHDGRWATDAQLAADRADAEAQKAADRKWKPLLEKWKGMLARPNQRGEAEANLLALTDPRAVPSILKVFGGQVADHPRTVRLLGQVDSPGAARALAYLAAFSGSADARRVATETLRNRDPREYADLLIALIRDKIRYEVQPVGGPGSPGVLHVEGKQANVDRVYAPPAPQLQPGDRILYDPTLGPVVSRGFGTIFTTPFMNVYDLMANPLIRPFAERTPQQGQLEQSIAAGLAAGGAGSSSKAIAGRLSDAMRNQSWINSNVMNLGDILADSRTPFNSTTHVKITYGIHMQYSIEQIRREAWKSAGIAQLQLANDQASLDRMNAETDRDNGRVVGVLRAATGQDLPEERDPWTRWWVDLLGYRSNLASSDVRPTFVEEVPLGYQPQIQPAATSIAMVGYQRISCFGAGTLVQTDRGPRAIETLKVGDVVLTQSTGTGALGYRPILVVHHNPPSGTFRIRLGGDTIVASAFHRFWVAGRGWVMARDLKAGDPVRTLGGVAAIESVGVGGTEPVFNLDVADDADFFAGASAALVHDNTLPDPRLVPFDRPEARKEVAAR